MLKGTLDDFSLPEIFRLTSHVKKTGRLEVERRNGSGRVYFRDGDVYYAESTKSKEQLGRKLIRSGRVTEEQLRSAVDENEATGRRVGEILVERGAAELEQIEWAVRSQIEDAVFDLLRWDLGAFVWEPDVEIEVEVPLTVTVDNLIIEASRRLDEISQIRRQIDSPEVVLAMAPRPPEGAHQINITPEEWQVLVLVDGRRSVSDIASFIGNDAFQTTRMLFGLMNAGLIYDASGRALAPGHEHQRDDQQPFQSKQTGKWFDSEDQDSNVVELQLDKSEPSSPPEPPAAPDFEGHTDEDYDRTAPFVPQPPVLDEEDEDQAEASVRPPSPAPAPKVDRAAVVRELAGLFSDQEKPKPRAVPSGSGDQQAPPDLPHKRRIEDDEDVDRGLISRMIDGVKEL